MTTSRYPAERWEGIPARQHTSPDEADTGAVAMTLSFDDADPVASCECGWHAHGDSINDAVLAWTKHITSSPCRDKL